MIFTLSQYLFFIFLLRQITQKDIRKKRHLLLLLISSLICYLKTLPTPLRHHHQSSTMCIARRNFPAGNKVGAVMNISLKCMQLV